MRRLFVSLNLPHSVQDEIKNIQQEWAKRLKLKVRWVRPEQAHITIQFLGDVHENRILGIIHILNKNSANNKALPLTLQGLAAFPNTLAARVLLIKIGGAGSRDLCKLQNNIYTSLKQLDLTIDSKIFTPHVTVGRLKKPAKIYTLPSAINPICWTASKLCLMESTLISAGPIYRTLTEIKLGEL